MSVEAKSKTEKLIYIIYRHDVSLLGYVICVLATPTSTAVVPAAAQLESTAYR